MEKLFAFEAFNSLFVNLGDMQEARDGFHNFAEPAIPFTIFGGDQFDRLGKRLMPIGKPLQTFVEVHTFSVSRMAAKFPGFDRPHHGDLGGRNSDESPSASAGIDELHQNCVDCEPLDYRASFGAS